jgi:hypothetical protein
MRNTRGWKGSGAFGEAEVGLSKRISDTRSRHEGQRCFKNRTDSEIRGPWWDLGGILLVVKQLGIRVIDMDMRRGMCFELWAWRWTARGSGVHHSPTFKTVREAISTYDLKYAVLCRG